MSYQHSTRLARWIAKEKERLALKLKSRGYGKVPKGYQVDNNCKISKKKP